MCMTPFVVSTSWRMIFAFPSMVIGSSAASCRRLEDVIVDKLQRRNAEVRPTNGTLQFRPTPVKVLTQTKLLGLHTGICVVLTAKLTRLTPTFRVGDQS